MIDECNELSKFLSYVLRHKPESIGLLLDVEGWVSMDDLIKGAGSAGKMLSCEIVKKVVSDSDKKRFEISSDGTRVRATQGHTSMYVKREYPVLQPPEFLYHGTATRFLDSIWKQGLVAGARHHVHLTQDEAMAGNVGRRYGKSVILRVSSYEMSLNGYEFFIAENNIWLTLFVPPDFIGLVD